MAAAAGGIIFCKVFGENILSFGGVCRHPIGDVTFGIIFCRGPNSTMDFAQRVVPCVAAGMLVRISSVFLGQILRRRKVCS